ncbi:MAG: rane protein [Bacteroidetes bacterium]|jgi:hypothetical protein|nr:rane protein [Bacteroidota bacterium]
MNDHSLQTYLPAFLVAFVLITFLWKWMRRFFRMKEYDDIENKVSYQRFKRIDTIFKIIFFLFCLMIIVYVFVPEFYSIFIPIESCDHPFINSIGLLILKAAFVWIVVAQVSIDKELYKYSRDINSLKAMELVYYSEQMLLGGLAVMFVGMFVTLTNVVGIIIGIVAVIIYLKVFSFKLLRKN